MLERNATDRGTRPLLTIPGPKGKILELLQKSTNNRKTQDVIKLYETTNF